MARLLERFGIQASAYTLNVIARQALVVLGGAV